MQQQELRPRTAHHRTLLRQRCGSVLKCHALQPHSAGQQLKILAQGGDIGLLAQAHGERATYRLEGRQPPCFTDEHLNDMQAEARVNQVGKNADLVEVRISWANSGAQSARVSQLRSPPCAPEGQLDSSSTAVGKPSASLSRRQRRSSNAASARRRSARTSSPGVTANRTCLTCARSP